MSASVEARQAAAARSALVSDIQDLKAAGTETVAQAKAKVPWLVGGVVVAVALGIGISVASRPRSHHLFQPRRSLLGKALRGAALSAIGLAVRHYAQQAIDKALPEPGNEQIAPVPPTAG